MSRKLIHVVAAVIKNSAGEILIAKRAKDQHQGGLWEFPGGKVEPGEEIFSALSRELNEELGIKIYSAKPLIKVPYHYTDKSVLLDVFEVTSFSGEAWGREGQPIQWVKKSALDEFSFPAANAPILNACLLPQSFAITPSVMAVDGLVDFVQQALSQGAQGVMLRNHDLSVEAFTEAYTRIKALVAAEDIPFLINSSLEMAEKLNADALHLSTSRLLDLQNRNQFKGCWLSASCHNQAQLEMAVTKKLDFAMLSPVSATASHPNTTPLGWSTFQEWVAECPIPVYALGGLVSPQIDQAVNAGGQGIAGISAWSQHLVT